MTKLSGLLLAAGESRRMGVANKLLLKIEGRSFVRRTAEQMMRFPFHEVVAVTGYEFDKVKNEIESLSLSCVYNKNYQSGMHSSIRAGLSSFQDRPDGILVCLSDQPFFHVGLIEKLATKFLQTEGPKIVFPVIEDQNKKGNPIFISKDFYSEILFEPDGDFGCNYLFKRHPEYLYPVVMNDYSILIDIDTPEQYNEWENLV